MDWEALKENIRKADHEEEKQALCDGCAWGQEVAPYTIWLYDQLLMMDAGCPIERWELENEEWRLLGMFKAERELWRAKRLKESGKEYI